MEAATERDYENDDDGVAGLSQYRKTLSSQR
jgi:hypothetical protein